MTKDICKQTGGSNRLVSICRSYLQMRTDNKLTWYGSLVSSLFRVGHALTVEQLAANVLPYVGQVGQ